jgi:hypothetical protein
MNSRIIFSSLVAIFIFSLSFGQDPQNTSSPNDEMSIFQFFRGDKPPKKKQQSTKPKTFYLSGIPVLSSNPVVGTAFGAVANGAFVIGGDYTTTRFSAVTSSVVYTTNEQATFAINNFLFFKENSWILQGTFNWRIFPMFTWGVGGNTPDRWASQLENNGFLFDQMLLKSIGSNWYVGGGININYVYGQEDKNIGNAVNFIENSRSQEAAQFWNGIDQTLPFVVKDREYPESFSSDWATESSDFIQENYFRTPFQLYPHGTGDQVFVLGLKLGLTHDSRDNLNSPRKGTYFNFNYNLFLEPLGNEKNFGTAKFDFRNYWMIKSYRDVIAVRSYMVFMTGEGPYINMPANNTDPNSTGTRGIPGFRYRGDNYIAAEVEYRKHLWKFLSGVAFVNAHTLTEKEQYLEAMNEPLKYDGRFRYVNPGYGLGLNIILDKASRMSISLAYAWNKNSFGDNNKNNKRGEFYMGMNAAF